MVTDQLTDLAREQLGPEPARILVTGGTGFVGSHLAKVLLAAGHVVTICGRNRYRYPIVSDRLTYAEVDLSDRDSVIALCERKDLVFHVGAKSSPWGSWDDFQRSNVDGTQNVVDGCLRHHVPRMVHVSSTAVFFQFTDRRGIQDDEHLPAMFCCDYAKSKAAAETIVNKAVHQGLNAIIIRARAVFGPGDSALLPRLILAARKGRLPQIGDGQNVIDMTHIDNLIAALILAAKCGESGAVCTITNDEPVRLWSLLRDVLRQLNVPAPRRRIPRSVAMTAASLLVWQHRVLRHSGEPVLTRYTAGLLSRTQTFDISAARRTLNYAPHVSMTEGVQRTLNAMTARDERDAPVAVRLRLFSTGFTAHRAHLAESGADRNLKIRFHAMFGLIEHPTEGLTLFDTGYAPRFFQATERLPYKLYRWTTPVSTCSDLAAVSVLRQHGINLSDVRRIVLSHFHADHVCGLLDFPNAEIITSARAWLSVQGKKGFAAVKRAILPDLFPADLHKRLRLIEHFHGPGFGPFESTHDLFGDGSVRMVNLSGHALGQIGLLLQRTPEEMDGDGKENGAGSLRCLLAADSVWTSRTFRENLPATLGFRLLAASPREARESQQVLHDFHRQFPHIEIIPTHCPEVASRYAFDLEVDRLLAEAKSHSSAGHCS